MVVISLRDAQDLYDLDDGVHGLLVMLHDPYQAPAVEAELAQALGPQYALRSWMQENANLLNALIVEKNVMFYLLFFIMIVAALCILSALITFVVQKTREIGMLKALGATDRQVSLVFLSQAALVGAVGDLAGYGLGMLALAYRNEFLHFMNRMTGFELFPGLDLRLYRAAGADLCAGHPADLRQRVGGVHPGRRDSGVAGGPAQTGGGVAL